MPADKKPVKKERRGSPGWMVTYGDMTTLLLTFFILMFTTAEIEGRELRLILSAFRGSFGLRTGGLTLSEGVLAELGHQVESLPAKEQGDKLAKAIEKAVSIFQPEVKSRKVKVTEDERGIVISLVADTFFESGSDELTPEGEIIINKIGAFLSEPEFRGNMIRIEGHTDSTPIASKGGLYGLYPTNWELSTGRAVKIVRIMNEDFNIDGENLQAVGYGEYQPVESNDIEEGRAYNRRIEIIIMRKKEYSL
ncbi:MAG: flagellar motor protein MotB [Spirochaetota bacterium]|nr:MAG: flagellar motor protein MotB [Spirochaetota bacterium]